MLPGSLHLSQAQHRVYEAPRGEAAARPNWVDVDVLHAAYNVFKGFALCGLAWPSFTGPFMLSSPLAKSDCF